MSKGVKYILLNTVYYLNIKIYLHIMGIYYGYIHYGVKISKKIISEDGCIFVEPMYEIIFDDKTISPNDYLNP